MLYYSPNNIKKLVRVIYNMFLIEKTRFYQNSNYFFNIWAWFLIWSFFSALSLMCHLPWLESPNKMLLEDIYYIFWKTWVERYSPRTTPKKTPEMVTSRSRFFLSHLLICLSLLQLATAEGSPILERINSEMRFERSISVKNGDGNNYQMFGWWKFESWLHG